MISSNASNLEPIPLPWDSIETVLLDMDGTLLDLHFDNYFWAEYLPRCYSKKYLMPIMESKVLLKSYSDEVKGQLQWYCLDYWSDKLNMDIAALKLEVGDKIAFRKNAVELLMFLRRMGKKVILATNAHPRTLELKLLKTDFRHYFNHLSSSHEIGFAKESQKYWSLMAEQYQFCSTKCLFIDDSPVILESAERYGIQWLLGICRPDSQKEMVDCAPYTGIQDFSQLILS
jgi:GMP/IMP 5'-nucleotidase